VKHQILIVEDNQPNCELLRDWLESEGYQVLVAVNLNDAFAAVRNQQPDAVLLDVQLGKDDGLALPFWMREQPRLCDIPVIAVTAQAMATDQKNILESGCKSIVPKPVNFKVLQQQLKFWLYHAKSASRTLNATEK
jgi:CheY-like chemotaxis protein